MRISALATSSLAFVLTFIGTAYAAQSSGDRITGPVSHDNLTVYFIHGASKAGPAPLTLGEALAAKTAEIRETGSVNSLEIENLGDKPIFVQAGDVVKGGRQDRTLQVSLLLPPKSGRIPIASFCVEHGRWSARNTEDPTTFASSAAAVPSREMKMAMQAPQPAVPAGAQTASRQQQVWDNVAKAQARLSAAAGMDLRAAASESSLPLFLENRELGKMREVYISALKGAGEKSDDIIGYVFAVNGQINSGEVYQSNALFRKMWPKLLDASSTEAISHRNDARGDAPSIAMVTDFIDKTSDRPGTVTALNFGVNRVTRESDKAWSFETASADGWVHRSYLAK
jgi:hypothetical protein